MVGSHLLPIAQTPEVDRPLHGDTFCENVSACHFYLKNCYPIVLLMATDRHDTMKNIQE